MRKAHIITLLSALVLAMVLVPLNGWTGGTEAVAVGANNNQAREAADQAHDASEAADAAANAAEAAKASAKAKQAAQEAGAAAGTSSTVSLSEPGQGVTASQGKEPGEGVSPQDREAMDGVNVNPQAWSPF